MTGLALVSIVRVLHVEPLRPIVAQPPH